MTGNRLGVGEDNVNAKLTLQMVRAVRRAYSARSTKFPYKRLYTQRFLAKQYKVSQSTINYIINKKSYTGSKIGHDTLKEIE